MPPLNQIEITIPGFADLNLGTSKSSSDTSVSSEISLDAIAKYQNEERRRTLPGNSSWSPDELDYSLSVLLPSNDSPEQEPKESLLGSNYSLDIKLPMADTTPPSPNTTNESPSRNPAAVELKKPRGASKVTFYPRVKIQRVTNRNNLKQKQIQDVWYSRDEFKAIRKECYDTIKLMKQSQILEEEAGLCVRGLEYKTPVAYKERLHNKAEIRTIVFEEQEYQFDNGMSDLDWISKLSQDQSRACVNAAIAVALQDAKMAKEYNDSAQ
jgi:hypothetical protein